MGLADLMCYCGHSVRAHNGQTACPKPDVKTYWMKVAKWNPPKQ